MRSFLILPLVSALAVASQDLFTVRSVKYNHCVSKHVIAKGYNVTAAPCIDAAHIRIHPVPEHNDRVVTASFKSVDHNLYVGVEGKPESPMSLTWVPHEYKWKVGRQYNGKYLIYLDDQRHLSWFDARPQPGNILLVAPNVYTPLPTLVWDIEPVKKH